MANPYNSQGNKKEQVIKMFDQIAFRYDFLNHFLSLGIDRVWRTKTINKLKSVKPQKILDIATGTGDLAIAALRLKPTEIIGIELSEEMLVRARSKMNRQGNNQIVRFEKGDAEQIQYPENTFDAVTVAFGVRNFENLEKGLSEIYRVLKPTGIVAVLEFSKPQKALFKFLYLFYFFKIVPLIGTLFSKDNRAYTYLPESVASFPCGNAFLDYLKTAGFGNADKKELTFGIATLYTGQK